VSSPSVGAFVLTYRRPTDLRRSLTALLEQSRPPDLLLIVDNASSPEAEGIVEAMRSRSRDTELVYEATGANLGSAGGTAYGTRRLAELGLQLIYSGDDDNPPRTTDTLERLLDLLASSPPTVAGVGTVGARFDWRRGELQRLSDHELEGPLAVDFIGGDHKLILRREVVEGGGLPNAELFFGYPDLEHCLRLRAAGWELRIDGELMRLYRELAGRLAWSAHRSSVPRRPPGALWRTYYTTRNYIHMMRTTFGHPRLALRESTKAVLRSVTAWRRGPVYGSRYAALQARALKDGWTGRLGRVVDPEPKGRGARDAG